MSKLTPEEKEQKKIAKQKAKEERKKNGETLWTDFKKFISRGNILDMSVGVIMGNAFGAIVTAFTNILLSICTWGVPGGIKGLVTVLPAVNTAQSGYAPALDLGQSFAASDLQDLARKLAVDTYTKTVVDANPNLIESVKTTILSKYTIHGTVYTYNLSAVIDWGTFINAVISFLIIAITLFAIVKIFNSLSAKRKAFEAQLALKAEQAKKAKTEETAETEETAKEAE